jgi:hypothetical protein
MKGRVVLGRCCGGCVGVTAHYGGVPLSLHVTPAFTLPIGESADYFLPGGAADLSLELGFTPKRLLFLAADLGYAYTPYKAAESLSTLTAMAGGGVNLELIPRLVLKAFAAGGYYYSFINQDKMGSGNPSLLGGLSLQYLVYPLLNLGIGAAYRNNLGLYQGLEVTLGTSFHITDRDYRKSRIDAGRSIRPDLLEGARRHQPGHGIEIQSLELGEIFPVFHKFYDDHPIGTAVLLNKEQAPLQDIRLTFFMKQHMDAPKECPCPKAMARGQSATVEVLSLFNDGILEITEATKAAAEVVLEYRMGGELYRDVRNLTVRIFDRNAMRWDDDRKAAAFVTAKDPKVLNFAKAVAAITTDKGPQAVDPNLQAGMALFKALDLYGLKYVIDPKTPFIELSQTDSQVDYLQFPRQTLEFRAGDCDDLSILFCALLESIGIETAFVTVPGHIFAAFRLETLARETARDFTSVTDLILRDSEVWVPVEVTERKEGFLRAWQEGAREWREAASRKTAGFYPIHEAWTIYEPVGLPGAGAELTMPSSDSILAAYLQEMIRFVDREIYPKVSRLEQEIGAGGGTPAARNRLGILYAKYGKWDKAEEQFLQALAKGEYTPALVNLGNLHFQKKDYGRARGYYERAAALDPKNATVQLSLAKVYHELEQYELARASYEGLKAADAALAERFAYLGGGDSAGARAGEIGARRETVLWSE